MVNYKVQKRCTVTLSAKEILEARAEGLKFTEQSACSFNHRDWKPRDLGQDLKPRSILNA
jgi:hypothetical protein